jgi:hypothetical protein
MLVDQVSAPVSSLKDANRPLLPAAARCVDLPSDDNRGRVKRAISGLAPQFLARRRLDGSKSSVSFRELEGTIKGWNCL